MNDEHGGDAPPRRAEDGGDAPERSARDELVDGLGLVLRAARRAAGRLDPQRLDELGQRAKARLGELDRAHLEKMGRAAAKRAARIDRTQVERFAGEAGRELVQVVDRLASRVERFVDEVQERAAPTQNGTDRKEGPPKAKLRVRDEGDE